LIETKFALEVRNMINKSGIIVLILAFGLCATIFPMNVSAPITGTPPPGSGDWIIANNTVVIDDSIDFAGSIIVNSGGTLTFDNSTLTINCASDGQYGIIVNSGGGINIKNSSIIDSSGVGNFYFMVRDGADFEMMDSTLKHCGYEDLVDYRNTGLYLECDGLIEDSTIDLCQQGLIAENGTVTVRNSRIEHSSWRNIEGRDANLILEDCTINATSTENNVEFGEGCTVIVTNCLISNARLNNIWAMSDVVATIDNCTIWGGKNNGIWADDNCDLVIKYSFIHNNTRSGLWINDSDIVCNNNIITDNGDNNSVYWDESGHGFAGFNGDVEFLYNTVAYNYGHNFETTNCTAIFNDNTFYPSLKKCNVEFFEYSQVTARNNYIDGAGHNCFWIRDGVVAIIENNIIKNSPHNGVWAGNDCTMTIRNNVIENCAESGIYAYNSTLTIEDNEINNCSWWGINTQGCTVTQSGNTFSNVAYGQVLYEQFIKVKATDKDGTALSGATITVKDSEGNEVWTSTTDANGETQCMLLGGEEVDIGGTSTTLTYTIEAEKDDLKATSDLTPDQTATLTLNLEAEGDEDDEEMDLTMIIALVVVVVIIILAGILASKKPKGPKESGESEEKEEVGEQEENEDTEETEKELEIEETEAEEEPKTEEPESEEQDSQKE
jgi:hypothetical protein